MDLPQLVGAIATAIETLDSSTVPFKSYEPGAGPYGEPQLVKYIALHLRKKWTRTDIHNKRIPDLIIGNEWALEFKIVRPFGNNGKPAENWSVNLLHPYPGNVSLLSDCIKLQSFIESKRKAVVMIGFEHSPPQIDLNPLIDSFECLALNTMNINIGNRVEEIRSGLIHRVHQQLRVLAWEVL